MSLQQTVEILSEIDLSGQARPQELEQLIFALEQIALCSQDGSWVVMLILHLVFDLIFYNYIYSILVK